MMNIKNIMLKLTMGKPLKIDERGDIIEVKPDRDGDMIYSITPRYVKLFREAEASRVRT